ncbi:hypothetical protein [Corynebacterium appendicis]|uniref:hypothetical protein n=1 Tax=Corynebacterium appendicis TaxID=163202 RepID=UPI002351FF10|nr:hypothetical protein [Corynebacterium appendicis]
MTLPNTPGPNGNHGNHGTPGPSSPHQQWGNQPHGPGGQHPAGSTAASTSSFSMPGWPTFASIGLFLLTLISSFLPILKIKTDLDAQRAQIEETLGDSAGDYGIDVEDFVLDLSASINWWAQVKFDGSKLGEMAQESEEEIVGAADLNADQVLLIALTSMVLIAYLASIVLGFFKQERFSAIVGLVAAALQVIAIVIAVVNYARANGDEEINEVAPTSLGSGFWIWLLLAIAAIAVFVYSLINSMSNKSAKAPAFAGPGQPGQPGQPQGFRPAQPQQQGFPQHQQFPPQGQPGPGFNPGQQQGPGGGNPYQQYGR